MCGGVRFSYSADMQQALEQFYTAEEVARFQAAGFVTSVFWQLRPVLPALIDGTIRLYDWGNRDDKLRLPKTGWVRVESLTAGKWDYLHPREVCIPAVAGVEKKVWFDITHGIVGYLVHRDGQPRVYMATTEPTETYRRLTGHDRMPVLVDQQI